jgi:ABC-type nitrate/sulfonate/bicarbonate transport system ATPase subunit
MAQLAVFAKTIALDPSFYLFDEPFSAIDYHSSLKLQKQFLDLWEKTKTPTLLVTHDIDEAIFLADKIIILSNLPSKIITIINNPIPRPRDLSCLGTIEAHELKTKILSYTTGFLL